MNALTIYDHHFSGAVTRRSASAWVPELVAAAGPRATDAYIEFFTATIRNRNTRLAYARACYQFFYWCQENGLTLDTVRPFRVAAPNYPLADSQSLAELNGVRQTREIL